MTLKSPIAFLLFFDPEDDYDPVPRVLALKEGDRIVVSGQIHKLNAEAVMLDHCKLI